MVARASSPLRSVQFGNPAISTSARAKRRASESMSTPTARRAREASSFRIRPCPLPMSTRSPSLRASFLSSSAWSVSSLAICFSSFS